MRRPLARLDHIFQFTTSRRGRQCWKPDPKNSETFQFTTSRRGRPPVGHDIAVKIPFNSRPHAEVDLRLSGTMNRYSSFNSRPHAEVDSLVEILPGTRFLSIHDLTQRSTHFHKTNSIPLRSFNSRPHAEVDFFHAFILPSVLTFNSRPHAEVDRP